MKSMYMTNQLVKKITTLSDGDTVSQNFAQIAPVRGGKHGYLAGVSVRVSGGCKESAEAGALTTFAQWQRVSSISLKGAGHVFWSSCPGHVISTMNEQEGFTRRSNKDENFATADIPTNDTEVAYKHTYMLTLAPGAFFGRLGDPRRGLFPLAAMRDQGEIDVVLADSWLGNWGAVGDTTIEIIAHIIWTKDIILSAPVRVDTIATSDTSVSLPTRLGACDMLYVSAPAAAAFTVPTAKPRLEVDGEVVEDALTGAQLVDVAAMHRDSDQVIMSVCPVIQPFSPSNPAMMLTGARFLLEDFSGAQGGICRYTCRRYLKLTDGQTASILALLGSKADLAGNPQALRMLDNSAAVSHGMNPTELIGHSYIVRG